MCFEIHLECEYCGKEIREWITKYENSEGSGEFFQLLTVVTKRDQNVQKQHHTVDKSDNGV